MRENLSDLSDVYCTMILLLAGRLPRLLRRSAGNRENRLGHRGQQVQLVGESRAGFVRRAAADATRRELRPKRRRESAEREAGLRRAEFERRIFAIRRGQSPRNNGANR